METRSFIIKPCPVKSRVGASKKKYRHGPKPFADTGRNLSLSVNFFGVAV